MSFLIFLLLVLVLASAVWTVLATQLLHSAIALALTSVLLSIVMFAFQSPWAAVFELSVCAGLITVVFISTISMTRHYSIEEEQARATSRLKRFIWLPVVLVFICVGMSFMMPGPSPFPSLPAPTTLDMRQVLWGLRRYDMLGQILVILAGIFGVVVLFKPKKREK